MNLPGDGIGREVAAEGVKVLTQACELYGVNIDLQHFSVGAQQYLDTGSEWEEGGYEACVDADAIFLGAVGLPGVNLPDGNIAGAGIIFGLRFGLDLYANVRPIKLYPGILHTIHNKRQLVWQPGMVDLTTIRENTEGLYTPTRGSLIRGGKKELAVDSRVITDKGARRIIDFAFKYARRTHGAPEDKKQRVTCVDKSNVMEGCRLFRGVYKEIAAQYPDIDTDYAYIDAYTQWLIRNPEHYNVVVASNMLGDIASDLSAVLGGSMGMAPSANIGVDHAFFEPVHGTAPKHAGKNEANPIAMILSGSMLLDYLAEKFSDRKARAAAGAIQTAVEELLTDGKVTTYDLGGSASTTQVGSAITERLRYQSI